MKLSIEEITDCIKIASVDSDAEQDILTNIRNLIAEKEAEKEENAKPKVPMQFVVVHDGAEEDGMAYIFSVPEEDYDLGMFSADVTEVIRKFNTSKKGQKTPVETLGQACEFIPSKFWKEHKIKVKTKEAVYAQNTQGILIVKNK